MKKKLPGILLVFVFLIGLSLLLYPTVSNYWNELHQSKAVSGYAQSVARVSEEEYQKLWQDAAAYNKMIAEGKVGYQLSESQQEMYDHLLQIDDSGVIGYIDIPAIRCTLPIYLGTEEKNLQVALGHIPWTSIPIGGEGTHSVISGHRGLPSAKLFTDLDKLVNGDRFTLHILNQTLTYEVDQINIILPEEVGFTKVDPVGDFCTLLTCTPYGVNTHRLLVRGHRVENDLESASLHIISEAIQISSKLVAAILFAFAMSVIMIVYLIHLRKLEKEEAERSRLFKMIRQRSEEEEKEDKEARS